MMYLNGLSSLSLQLQITRDADFILTSNKLNGDCVLVDGTWKKVLFDQIGIN